MEARDFRNLTEAYYQVYENQELDEAPFQIYGPPLNGPSDASSVRIGKPYQEGQNPRAARKRAKTRAEKLNQEIGGHRYTVHKVDEAKEEVDLYDIILSHLLDEGYAETSEAAEVMMVNMSKDWISTILEGSLADMFSAQNDKLAAQIQQRKNAADRIRKLRDEAGSVIGNTPASNTTPSEPHMSSSERIQIIKKKLDDAEEKMSRFDKKNH